MINMVMVRLPVLSAGKRPFHRAPKEFNLFKGIYGQHLISNLTVYENKRFIKEIELIV